MTVTAEQLLSLWPSGQASRFGHHWLIAAVPLTDSHLRFTPQVTNAAWAFTVRQKADVALYNSLALRACQIMDSFKPSALAMLVGG